MTGSVSEAVEVAAAICRPFEGLRLKPYICPAGYPTIGYGTVYKPDGAKVTMDDAPITKETAEAWLLHELRHTYIAGVLKASPHLIAYPKILGAMGDFAYNLGVPRYRASTLRRRIAERDWEGAKTELMRWNKANGRVLPGLTRRRKAECKLL
jgi:lysozyme